MPTDHTCNNIRILRERNHETQRELAEALGLAGAPAIANYEIGGRARSCGGRSRSISM